MLTHSPFVRNDAEIDRIDRQAAEALAIERAELEESIAKRNLISAFLNDLVECEMSEETRIRRANRQARREAAKAKGRELENRRQANLARKRVRFAAEATAEANLGISPGWNVRESEGRPTVTNRKAEWTGGARHKPSSVLVRGEKRDRIEWDFDVILHTSEGVPVRVRRAANTESYWVPNIDVRFKGGCPNTRCTPPYTSRAKWTPDGWYRNGVIFPF